jgi:hypothetical protein
MPTARYGEIYVKGNAYKWWAEGNEIPCHQRVRAVAVPKGGERTPTVTFTNAMPKGWTEGALSRAFSLGRQPPALLRLPFAECGGWGSSCFWSSLSRSPDVAQAGRASRPHGSRASIRCRARNTRSTSAWKPKVFAWGASGNRGWNRWRSTNGPAEKR